MDFCESEKTRKELEVQNEILEEEMKSSRRKSLVEESLPNLQDLSPVQANFLEKIIEKFLGSTEQNSNLWNEDKKDVKTISLYDIHHLIKEANSLCSNLGKEMILSQRDMLTEKGLEIMVRVHDTRHNLQTYWTIEKLQEKLLILREFAKGKPENLSDVFKASDSWEKNDKKFIATQLNQSIKELGQKNGRSSLSSSCISSPLKEPTPCIPRYSQTSVVDNILQSLSEIQVTTSFILENCNKSDLFSDVSTGTVTSLFGQFQYLTGVLSSWLRSESLSDSTNIEDLKDSCWIQARELGNSIAFIIQGMEKEVHNTVKDWSISTLDNIHQLCCYIGELAMIQDSPVTIVHSIGDNCRQKVDNKIKVYFQQGTNKFLKQSILSFINDLIYKESKVKNLVEDSFCSKEKDSYIVETVEEMLQKIRLWMTVINNKLFESDNPFPEDQDLMHFDHVKNIIDQLCSLISGTSKLTQLTEELIKGDNNCYHLQKCIYSIKASFKKLSEFMKILMDASSERDRKTQDVKSVCEKMLNFLLTELKSVNNRNSNILMSSSSQINCQVNNKPRSSSVEKCVRFNLEDSVNIFSSVSGSFTDEDVLDI